MLEGIKKKYFLTKTKSFEDEYLSHRPFSLKSEVFSGKSENAYINFFRVRYGKFYYAYSLFVFKNWIGV